LTVERPQLVWFAGVHWDALRGTDRHLVTAVSEHADVIWVDPALSLVRRFRPSVHGQRNRGRGVTHPHQGITRVTVTVPPFSSRPGMRRVAAALVSRAARRVTRRAERESGRRTTAVVVALPEPLGTGFGDTPLVYFATDDFVTGGALLGLDAEHIERVERAVVARSSLVVGVTQAIVDRWATRARKLVLPNGCLLADDTSPLEPAACGIDLTGPVAAVVGQFSPRVDLRLLEAVAGAGLPLLLIGPHDPSYEPARFAELVRAPNVRWLDQQPYDRVQELLRAVHVGLTPYTDTPFNRASFPLKTLEYLAAGRSVVSTDLPAVQMLDSDQITVASDPEAYAAAVAARLAEPLTADSVAACRATAARHTWAVRADTFLAELRDLT
jgi:teichuronic acid biosynthesis glycosyltransferase TuaH